VVLVTLVSIQWRISLERIFVRVWSAIAVVNDNSVFIYDILSKLFILLRLSTHFIISNFARFLWDTSVSHCVRRSSISLHSSSVSAPIPKTRFSVPFICSWKSIIVYRTVLKCGFVHIANHAFDALTLYGLFWDLKYIKSPTCTFESE